MTCVYVFSLILLIVMTWRWPSTAETCSHGQTNKYDPTTVLFWRTHPPSDRTFVRKLFSSIKTEIVSGENDKST
jgi:hypothetical protein